jgi:hypothetical protein
MASTIDLLPTLVEITGAPEPALEIDGVSIVPLLEGDATANPRNQFFFYYDAELRGVREGNWKRVFEHRTRSYVGVEPGNDGHPGPYAFPTVPNALYDLSNDVNETTDVSAENPDVVARLDALADTARARLGDRLTMREGSEVRPPGRRGFQRAESLAHLGVGAAVTLADPPSPQYPGSGAATLTDGKVGSRDFRDRHWLGFEAVDLRATIDLGSHQQVRRIGLDCLQSQTSWIFYPETVAFEISEDGVSWKEIGMTRIPVEPDPLPAVRTVTANMDFETVRFIRIRAQNVGRCPDWHQGAGGQSWLFVDEIVVE